MNSEIVACLGGWCVHRTHCAHYYSSSKVMSERLCPKGEPMPIEFRVRVPDADLPEALRNGALEVF